MGRRRLPRLDRPELILSGPRASEGTATSAASPTRLFRHGFITSSANPFTVMFFAALFRQFIDPATPTLPQLAIVGGTYLLVDCLILLAWGSLGAVAASQLRTRALGLVNRTCGTLVLGASFLLAGKDLELQQSRSDAPQGSAPWADQDESSKRGRTTRRRAILHTSRSETPGVTSARRRKKPARYRLEAALRCSCASFSSPARSAPAARAPWTWSRTEGRGADIRGAWHGPGLESRADWIDPCQNPPRRGAPHVLHGSRRVGRRSEFRQVTMRAKGHWRERQSWCSRRA